MYLGKRNNTQGGVRIKIALVAQSINEETFSQLAMPIGLCYLSSYTQKYLFQEAIEFSIFDGTVSAEMISADIVGISSMSRYIPGAIKLACQIKQRENIPVILGGPHITALPHTLPPSFDIGVIDEGEETFLELCKIYRVHKAFPKELLANVKGISYHKEGKVQVNPPRDHIEPLDRIPYPDRDLWNIKDRIKWVASSRGCPYACAFCGMARSRYRKFPAEYVVAELIQMKEKYGLRAITFQDDLFVADKKRLKEIRDLIRKHGLEKELSFMVSLRADLIDRKTMELLKEMNVTNIFMGIESASEHVLKFLKNNTVTVKDIQKSIDLCHEFDIQLEGSFIIGSPMETLKDLKTTYDFIYDNYCEGKLDMIAIYTLTPFPGTKVWDIAKDRGLVTEDMDWSLLNLFTIADYNPQKCIHLCEHIPVDEFGYYVNIFKKLLLLVNNKGIGRMKRNIFDPMNVKWELDKA